MVTVVYVMGPPPESEHKQVSRQLPDAVTGELVTVDIDEMLVGLIDNLNKLGFRTTACCQGDRGPDFLVPEPAHIGFTDKNKALVFFDLALALFYGSEWKGEPFFNVSFSVGYNPEFDLHGYSVEFDQRLIPELERAVSNLPV